MGVCLLALTCRTPPRRGASVVEPRRSVTVDGHGSQGLAAGSGFCYAQWLLLAGE